MMKTAIIMFCLACSLCSMAQDEVETTISADFVSHYIWRGQHLGDVSIQPTLGVEYKGLSLSAWGNYGLSNSDDAKELDLTLSYTLGGFNIGVTDYWSSDGLDPEGRYFKYDAHGTNHVFEANVGYDFKLFSLQAFTNFAGCDGENKDGDRAYSMYFEANVPFALAGVDWSAQLGVVPFATTTYDTSDFSVTNVSLTASKDIKVTEHFSIPAFVAINTNPCSKHAWLVFGFTLRP